MSFVYNICFIPHIILQISTEHGSITTIICVKYENDYTTWK